MPENNVFTLPVPLMPSIEWMGIFIRELNCGKDEIEATKLANLSLESSKDFGRFTIHDVKGDSLTLSVAVEGGGRQLRDLKLLPTLRLSEHGEWRRNHLRTIEACLGKKPFFPYLFPSLENVYLNKNITSLTEFNAAILNIILSFIYGNITWDNINDRYQDDIILERGKEIYESIGKNRSSLEVIMTYGKESLLGFIAWGHEIIR